MDNQEPVQVSLDFDGGRKVTDLTLVFHGVPIPGCYPHTRLSLANASLSAGVSGDK